MATSTAGPGRPVPDKYALQATDEHWHQARNQTFARGGSSAEGTSVEWIQRRRGGVSPPQPTRGLGERRELPQRGLGRSPSRWRILHILSVI